MKFLSIRPSGLLLVCSALTITALSLQAQIATVATYHNDSFRTGWNYSETTLNPSNVNKDSFGKLGSLPVDGQVYAQPLFVPNLTTRLGQRNVLFVATEHDSVYAFDADLAAGGTASVLWHVSFLDATKGITTMPSSESGSSDITPEIGITGTPVIDLSTSTLYVAAKVKYSNSTISRYAYLISALDLATGRFKYNSPAVVKGSFPGNCLFGRSGSTVLFDAFHQHNRPALVLFHETLYVSFASHGDTSYYTGWLFAYNAKDVTKQLAVWNSAPNTINGNQQCRAGIWMGGAAPAFDGQGNLYLATGNGEFNASSGGNDYGDSVVKLNSALGVTDFFTPYDQQRLSDTDADLGAGGVLLLPDQPGQFPHLLVQTGKAGTIYLVNRDSMGGYSSNSNNPQIVQNIPNGDGGVWGSIAYFNGNVFFGGKNDYIRGYALQNGLLSTSATQTTLNKFGYPGPTPSVSSSGLRNGIVWAIDPRAWNSGGPAVIYAYDANNLATELWDSTQSGSRDTAGQALKFTVPTIANGRVYVGTGTRVDVFGLLN